MKIRLPTDLLVALAKAQIGAVCRRVRRATFAKVASRLSLDVLDDARLAATEEMARRGVHVMTHRPRLRKVAQRNSHGAQETR